jgi:hypothetical protein
VDVLQILTKDLLVNILKEGEVQACVLKMRYFAQRYNANGIEKVRIRRLLARQNGEDRTFKFKRSTTLEAEGANDSKSADGVFVVGSKRVALQSSPPRCMGKAKKLCPSKEDDVEFQFAILPCGRIDMF